MKLKTSEERANLKKQERLKKDAKVIAYFNKLRESYNVNDASIMTANEFGLSVPTIYNIRKRNDGTTIS